MPKITFSETGKSFEVEAGASLLDFCQVNDTPVNFGCTAGNCGTCAAVVEGADGSVTAMTEDEKEMLEHSTDMANARLCCLLTVNGDITIGPI